MGWDCTLHVVDESSLARFEARFLHGLHRDRPFDREYDGDDLIAKVKELIAEDPDTGARALSELALLYVSTETPHVYCRGFALSLWDDQVMGAALPAKWLGSVETRVPGIIAAYPRLAGHVPKAFDSSYCVGPMVSARDVPALLRHVEGALGAMTAHDAARFRGLRDVLAVAAARGLAYWEATDINVVQTHEDWLAAIRPPALITAANPLTSPLARPIASAGTRMLVGEHFVFYELDTATFPPGVITNPDMHVTAAAFTPWGTELVRMATDRTERPFKFSYYELPSREPLAIEPRFPIGTARSARDCVLLFPQRSTSEATDVRPLVLRPGPVLEPLDVPEAKTLQSIDCAAIEFGDGTYLIVWDGLPYRWDCESAPLPLGAPLRAPEDDGSAVVLSDGSIVGGFGRKLIRIDREGTRETILPLDNVMMVAKGPDDVLVIGEGDNPENDALKVWWPASREITQISKSALGLTEAPTFIYYDAIQELVVAARPGMWHALPWAAIAEMRRVTELPPRP